MNEYREWLVHMVTQLGRHLNRLLDPVARIEIKAAQQSFQHALDMLDQMSEEKDHV
jgi:hypothetical protein